MYQISARLAIRQWEEKKKGMGLVLMKCKYPMKDKYVSNHKNSFNKYVFSTKYVPGTVLGT